MSADFDSQFVVTWSMPIEASDAVDAAQQALGIHRDPDSIATWFRVDNLDDGSSWKVDLNADGSLQSVIRDSAPDGEG